ncbi:eukaryotic translation initiation factor 2-alpha kinase-like [Centruroides sculpturatus]|uniref:eukaryotic translation initiation factor 2-alpha kinase-like n=1 Tax=Centruroides sculpturatus TaxID=218467 RepID=UPI000C6E5D0D|nr:eukaryotic translation initiation factor 2-alpha kinase-like [Centruroides sculpturatus]
MEKFLYFSFVYLLLLTPFSFVNCQNKRNELPNCNIGTSEVSIGESKNRRELFIVSTLDGKISALDPNDGGKLIWSHDTEPGALLSSSISNLELYNNGDIVRMIPSLDGNLYVFNGETIEPVPVLPETLLQHSYKFGDNNVITGGKETSSYGINPQTGQIRYMCNMAGCTTLGESVSSTEEIFVLKRHTQILRSVDSRTGVEKWNFSVGEHHMSFIDGLHSGCGNNEQVDEIEEIPEDNFQVKVYISDGIVTFIEKNTGIPLWTHKLDSPIVNLWKFRNGIMEFINLFDPKVFSDDQNCVKNIAPPLLYLGIHNNQPYIQHSKGRMNAIFGVNLGDSTIKQHFHWKPYLITASSRTPHINLGNHVESDSKNYVKNVEKTKAKTALILKSDQLDYPYDSGYYLYETTEVTVIDVVTDNTSQCEEEETFPDIIFITGSLWDYWKEVLGISVASAIILNIICLKCITKTVRQTILNEASNSNSTIKSCKSSSSSLESKNGAIQTTEIFTQELKIPQFISRYVINI